MCATDIVEKTLYMLIGPKGSGKTYIGTLVEKETDISFLRVENIWLSLNPEEDGWKKVEYEIDKAFEHLNKLLVESLGAGEDFHRFHDSLNNKYKIKLVRVCSDPDICLNRVINRDKKNHLAVSDAKVEEYNKIAAQVKLDWDIEINNNNAASSSGIIQAIKSL
jgi:predicted ABC-type ATPase